MRSLYAVLLAIFAVLSLSGCGASKRPTNPDSDGPPAVYALLALVVPDCGEFGLQPGANPDLDFYFGIRARLHAHVSSWGRVVPGDCRVVFSADGRALAESTVTIPPGADFLEVEGPEWEPGEPGDHRLSVRIDLAPQVGDRDSTDNRYESVVAIHPTGNLTGASVVVMDMSYPHSFYYSTVVLGSTHWVWFLVRRSGFCQSYQVRLTCGPDTILVVRDSCSVGAGWKELYYFCPWTFRRVGSFAIRAVVDADDEWAEESETDNIATSTITVVPAGSAAALSARKAERMIAHEVFRSEVKLNRFAGPARQSPSPRARTRGMPAPGRPLGAFPSRSHADERGDT